MNKIILYQLPLITMDLLLSTIYNGIEARKNRDRYDAYFDLPEDFTIDQIKLLQKTIESNTNKLKCRLYTRYRLQVYWDLMPKRNLIEYLHHVGAIHDIDEQLELFDLANNNNG